MQVTLGAGIASFEDPVIGFAPFAGIKIVEGQIVMPMVVGAHIQIAPDCPLRGDSLRCLAEGRSRLSRGLNTAAQLSHSPRQRERHQKGAQRK